MKKRIVSAFLAVIICLAASWAGTQVTFADTSFEEGDFRYTLTGADTVMVSKYLGGSTEVELPEFVNGRLVTGVYSSCFEDSDIVSVTIPRAYSVIGAFAFRNCKSLSTVRLPSSLKTIGIMAFSGCESLSDIDIDTVEALSTISFSAFSGCSALQSVTIPDTVTSLGDNAFCNCSSLSEIKLSASLTAIPEYAFYNCALGFVGVPDGVAEISECAFAENTSLEAVEIPRSCVTISDDAFQNCPNVSIGCYANSAAYDYAVERELDYYLIDVVLGDATGDRVIDVNDVTAIQRSAAMFGNLDGVYLTAADTNLDGTVDIIDATVLQKYIAGYEIDYPIGEPLAEEAYN